MESRCTTLSLLALAWVGFTLSACPGDDATGEGTDATSSGATTTASSTSSGGPTSDTATSVATGSMDSTGPGTTTTATSPTSTGDSGSTTNTGETEGVECSGLGPRECDANAACMPIAGAPILMPDGGACLGPREFIECQPATGCGDAITFACPGLDAPQYQFNDTCTPTGWIDCGPPPKGKIPPC